jgi:hypothetical protein
MNARLKVDYESATDADNYIVNIKNRPMESIDIPIATIDDIDKERVDYIKKI